MENWQVHCTQELLRCRDLEINAPGAGRSEWERVRQSLEKQRRIILADVNLDRANLRGFNFYRCYLVRVSLVRADLVNAEFYQSIVRKCDLSFARLDGADLSLTDLRGSQINFATPVEQIRGVRPHLAEAIRNHQYRADFDAAQNGFILRIWNSLTNYGNSLFRVLLVSTATIILFGATYYLFQWLSGQSVISTHQSMLAMTAFAAECFLNSAPPYSGDNLLLTWLVIANIALGVGALGVFIAILSRKLITYVR